MRKIRRAGKSGKLKSLVRFALAATLVVVLVDAEASPAFPQQAPTAKQKMATVEYLVGTWGCGHTVGDFAGKYTTTYSKVLDGRWLRETYDFPPKQFGENEKSVKAEVLIGFDERRQAWVRFFADSEGDYFPIRMTETPTGWAYKYVSFFPRTKPETSDADATFTKKSDTEYEINGPTYPENGKMVTEHHVCHKQ